MDRKWKLSDFEYELPEELIAQQPAESRDQSRLLVVHRESGELEHRCCVELPDFLRSGDCLVLNDSRVLPARLRAYRDPTGGRVEILMLHPVSERSWEVLVRPGRAARPGQHLVFAAGESGAEVVSVRETGERVLTFDHNTEPFELMRRFGEVPLPPYIHEELSDTERYQTVFAQAEGSVAAPTAGLHFTSELLAQLKSTGVKVAYITLHVGVGTFRPVRTQDVAAHQLPAEYYTVAEDTARIVNQTRADGRRIVAVGTTTTRTLETCARGPRGQIEPRSGWTDLFIRPGFEFRAIDALLTNFHLPRSTLLMLVAAFTGHELMQRAYRVAIDRRYRFYSLGDAMLIL